MKDGEEINQRTFMHNPWIPTIMWGLAWVGESVGLEKERAERNVRTTIKA